MKELYELKDMLCEELKEYGKKPELSAGSLDVIDKLAHAMKSLETILAMEEAEYGNSSNDVSNMYPYYYRRGSSYARGGRMRGGSYAQRRDSRGRYSREDGYSGATEELADELRGLMEEAPDDHIRTDIQKLVQKLEKM